MHSSAQLHSPPSYTHTTRSPRDLKITPTCRPRTHTPQKETPVALARSLRRRTLLANGADNTPQGYCDSPRNFSDAFSSPSFGDGGVAGKGGANLADELAGLWEGEEGERGDGEEDAFQSEWEESPRMEVGVEMVEGQWHSPVDVGSPASKSTRVDNSSPISNRFDSGQALKQKNNSRSRQISIVNYEPVEFSSSLQDHIAEIEAFVSHTLASTDGPSEISRLSTLLCGISGHSHLETLLSTYINTHTTLTTTLLQHTRLMNSLSSILLSPFSTIDLDTLSLEDLLPGDMLTTKLLSTIPSISQRTSTPQHHLDALSNTTSSIITTLSNLTDALYIEQEISATFARRLRSTRELVAKMKEEEVELEAGKKWLEEGGWQERLEGRECGRRCAEVVRGFEEVCGGWRERLIAGTV